MPTILAPSSTEYGVHLQVGKDKQLDFDPCSVTYHDSKYICVGGSDKKVHLRMHFYIVLALLCIQIYERLILIEMSSLDRLLT